MQRLDLSFPAPAMQLAADEALLDWCEEGRGGETFAFWEPRETFVVVGYANQVADEVNIAACERRGIPIFRRCSGGGTVVQMPGGLNYSLILRITENSPTRNISSANQFIMERNRAAMQSALGNPAGTVSVRGHTDLTLAAPHSTAFLKIRRQLPTPSPAFSAFSRHPPVKLQFEPDQRIAPHAVIAARLSRGPAARGVRHQFEPARRHRKSRASPGVERRRHTHRAAARRNHKTGTGEICDPRLELQILGHVKNAATSSGWTLRRAYPM